MWACEKGYSDMVDYLLEHGANVQAEDVNYLLYMYSLSSMHDIVMLWQKNEWTGLVLSSRKGHLEIVRKLLDKGAYVNQLTTVSMDCVTVSYAAITTRVCACSKSGAV